LKCDDLLVGEKRFNTRSQGTVITQVTNGSLIPNAAGVVKLPASMASTTTDGNVYVTVDSAGTTWILFPTWRGKGANTFAYVYHSTPATGGAPTQVQLNGPDVSRGGTSTSIDYQVDRQIDANWCHVVWNMD